MIDNLHYSLWLNIRDYRLCLQSLVIELESLKIFNILRIKFNYELYNNN